MKPSHAGPPIESCRSHCFLFVRTYATVQRPYSTAQCDKMALHTVHKPGLSAWTWWRTVGQMQSTGRPSPENAEVRRSPCVWGAILMQYLLYMMTRTPE